MWRQKVIQTSWATIVMVIKIDSSASKKKSAACVEKCQQKRLNHYNQFEFTALIGQLNLQKNQPAEREGENCFIPPQSVFSTTMCLSGVAS